MVLAGMTASDWVERTRQYLLSQHREELTLLSSAYNPGDGVLNIASMTPAIQAQAYLEVDLEIFYVVSASGASGTPGVAIVVPAQLGTKEAVHAVNAAVTVNPRFPRAVIFGALNNALATMGGPNYYAVGSTQLTWNPPVYGYDLGVSQVNDIYDVSYPIVGQSIQWARVYSYELRRNQLRSAFPSGNAIFFYETPGTQQGQPINITYFSDFTPVANLTDDVSITGLPSSGYDLPPLGAAIRLMAGREVKRNFIEGQPEPRRATEVTPGAVAASANGLKQEFQARLLSESMSLMQQYPKRREIWGRQAVYGRWR